MDDNSGIFARKELKREVTPCIPTHHNNHDNALILSLEPILFPNIERENKPLIGEPSAVFDYCANVKNKPTKPK